MIVKTLVIRLALITRNVHVQSCTWLLRTNLIGCDRKDDSYTFGSDHEKCSVVTSSEVGL